MPFRPDVIRYRSNGIILGQRPLGKFVQDDVTGYWTYEAYLTTNAFGERVDSRGDGMDAPRGDTSVNQKGPYGYGQE